MAPDGSAVTIAVDTNGADLGPAEVAAGAATAAAQGVRVLLFGPAEAIGGVADGGEVIDAPVSIAKASDPAIAVRSTPDASIVQAARAVAEGRAQAFVAGGSNRAAAGAARVQNRRASGRGAGGGPLQHGARERAFPPRPAAAPADPRQARDAARRRRQRRIAPGAPRPVRLHGRGARAGGPRRRGAAGGAAQQRRGGDEGHGAGPRDAREARGLAA